MLHPFRNRRTLLNATYIIFLAPAFATPDVPGEREIALSDVRTEPVSFRVEVGETGQFTWWLPRDADAVVLPISGGMVADTNDESLMAWLRKGSPWSLSQLPAFGLRFGDRTLVVIVPWPHYAELVIEKRIGVRFIFASGRRNATPCELVAVWRGSDPLEVARGFRAWRQTSAQTGGVPRPRRLLQKVADNSRVSRLFGAPHFYLWGPALIGRHDVDRAKWLPFSRMLRDAAPESFAGRVVARFSPSEHDSLNEMAEADFPTSHVAAQIAAGLEHVLIDPTLLNQPPDTPLLEVVRKNRKKMAVEFSEFVHEPATWGDGMSLPMLDALHDAGVDRAVILLSDFHGNTPRPDVVARAAELGFLSGPYDSYHSVHSPDSAPDATWETAQFDRAAYEQGRVLNADGSGHAGFRGRGFHFSPSAAWPYVQQRVGTMVRAVPYTAWFIDCDATAECFDDYDPRHEATRVDDISARRHRLRWLESEHQLVVGSEDGSALFSDVVHFGHGVHTPYIGHLEPSFRDRQSRHFLGRYWPPDTPEQMFKPVPIVPSLVVPYFEPRVRIPLYQAALGDELVVSHHWSFDSLKFWDIAVSRELLEILYMVPPMYHINREVWPKRRERIIRHHSFWAPWHRELATACLTQFEWLTEDRVLQRTTFTRPEGDVTITVNFDKEIRNGYPAYSASISGAINVRQDFYQADMNR